MKVWVILNKRKEFRYFYKCPEFSGKNDTSGHYERVDTWPSDIDYACRDYQWVPDEPEIPPFTWYVRLNYKEVDYGKRLPIKLVPPIRRKITTPNSEPFSLDLAYEPTFYEI